MAAKKLHPRTSRNRTIECLEDRRMMAVDPLGASIADHIIADEAVAPMIEHYGRPIDEPPQLVHHGNSDADFWLDVDAERDIGSLLGDIEQTLAQAHGLTGLTQVRNNYGFVGSGQTVAVIDSGIAFDHYALGGGLGGNYRVVGGWDFAENDANPYDDGPEGSHGTHVAGIVGADRAGKNDDGIAPGVDLVGLRVFDDVGNGYFSWVEHALQWVHQNRNAFENPITSVNLSLGTQWNATTIPMWSKLEEEFAQLKADGIFVAVAAGNDFRSYNTPGLTYPAASPHVVPVMSVDDNGSFSSFSQRHPTALAAPGRYIVSTIPDYIGNNNGVTDDFASFSGTSMAAPYVAGASVILREAMQFVGYTNITQTTLFNHMMATADTFFDAATNLNYKRLDLNSAISALMPIDDYGSTASAAFNLGTLSRSREITGLIGSLSDTDYFRFTAAATSTVSFTITATHGLAPVWTGSGVVNGGGRTFTFDVVAGQSYTLGLSTNGGIGYYDLAIEADSAFTFTDLGNVTQAHINNIANSGERWYRVQAGRSGYLTAEALFAAAGGNIDIAWYNSSLQLLASGVANASGERVDVTATAGTECYLRVAGTNADVDFRLTNLVSQSGNVVSVAGTAGADVFGFNAGTTHQLSVNGVSYSFASASQNTFQFSGDAGSDAITMTGPAGIDTAMLKVGNASIAGSNFFASATAIEYVAVNGGGGGDIAFLYDSASDDTFTARSFEASMVGGGYSNRVYGFGQVNGYATAGGYDKAEFFDTVNSDTYAARPSESDAFMSSPGRFHYAKGFERVNAYSTAGGYDLAMLYDSAGNDVVTFRPAEDAFMSSPSVFSYTKGFERINAYATAGGYDTANFYGTAGIVFNNRPAEFDAFMSTPTIFAYAKGFERFNAYATAGGYDRANFFGTSGNDNFVGRARQVDAYMHGLAFFNYAPVFERVDAYGGSGGNDKAALYDSLGNDMVNASGSTASLFNPAIDLHANQFDRISAHSVAGGSDTATVGTIDFIFEEIGAWN